MPTTVIEQLPAMLLTLQIVFHVAAAAFNAAGCAS
jgi:hypothetical protein